MATRFNIFAYKIPRIEEPGGLQSRGLQRARTTGQLSTWHTATNWGRAGTAFTLM